MSYEPFLIAPYTSGLETDTQPWLLPKDAFQSIVNGYIHHGVLFKRGGIQLVTTLSNNLPVMGIKNFINSAGVKTILGFDTIRAYLYDETTQTFSVRDAADIFDRGESAFVNAVGVGRTISFTTPTLYFTNFSGVNPANVNPMRSYAGGANTTVFTPDSTPAPAGTRNYILAAQYIFYFRNRLVLLNTVEGANLPVGIQGNGTQFAQRVRWSKNYDPTVWDQNVPGNGGFADAPTSDQIVGATQLQDLIIVQFTNSVWALKPLNDPAAPFRWEKINSFRACEAPYANIGHDRYVISFGVRGVVATDSVEVQRIDQKIDQFIVNNVNLDFIARMYSERDYTNRRSWTLFPSSVSPTQGTTTEPETSNRALIRSEEEGAWSVYNVETKDGADYVNMSCLGYIFSSIDAAWQNFDGTDPLYPDWSWEEFGDRDWNSYFTQAQAELFVAGDQNGRILSLENGGTDLGEDISFDVVSAAWNPYKEKGVQAQLGYVDFYVDADTDTQFTVEFYVDDIDFPYATQTLDCLPNLGFIADIFDIVLNNPVEVEAPSHGLTTGNEVFIYNLNGAGDLTGGPYTVTVVDEDNLTLDGVDGTAFSPYVSGGTIVEREFNNTKCWKRAYAGGKGYQHFIRITNSGSDDILQFNAFMPWFRPASTRIIG
jgi:hypothetical protein